MQDAKLRCGIPAGLQDIPFAWELLFSYVALQCYVWLVVDSLGNPIPCM
jgi:hypothetical protein